MTKLVLLACAACLAPLVGALPVDAQAPKGWPLGLEDDVREQIGRNWEVDVGDIRLVWGLSRGPAPVDDSQLELVGSGSGGHWIVRIASATGDVAAVRVRGGVAVARPVAGRRFERGEVVAAHDIVMRDTVVWGRPAAESVVSMEGWVTHRPIQKGEALASPAVQQPLAVEASRPVDLLWDQGMIGVRISGTAVRSGRVGEEILVRTESGTRLWGIVVAPGTVRLTHARTRAASGGLS